MKNRKYLILALIALFTMGILAGCSDDHGASTSDGHNTEATTDGHNAAPAGDGHTTAAEGDGHNTDGHTATLEVPAGALDPDDPKANPVQAEMRALDIAYKNAISAVIFNQLENIPASFHAVHKYRENVVKAAEANEIELPKNQEKFADFVALDDAFHADIEKVVEAAQAKNVEEVKTGLQKMMNGCVECHTEYRNK